MKVKNRFKYVTSKAIISGNVLELFEYENGYSKGLVCTQRLGRSCQASEKDKIGNRAKVVQRAHSHIRRLANANLQLNKFFTLTFKDNVTDIKFANNEFNKFIRRLNYYSQKTYLANKLNYIAVIEFQKRGAVHYHVLCDMPYIDAKVLEKIWGNGFIKINKIDNVDNIGAYITKYMTKDKDDKRLHGFRSFFTSQGLNKPIETVDDEKIIELLAINTPIRQPYVCIFESEHYGKIKYSQYVYPK